MSLQPVVIKLGGDALASPERIVAQAGRLARRALREPVIAVTSARRGTTDHLLELVAGVRRAGGAVNGPHPEVDRAVAVGEEVSAALLALALEQLGCQAVSLDAREAGLMSDGRAGQAQLTSVDPTPLLRLLDRGVVPVVTGFQGWHEGRVTTLGRGGSDTTAVALAVAAGAQRTELVKEAGGLYSADPLFFLGTSPVSLPPHRFLTALAAAGARVVHPDAASLAERHGLPLHLMPLDRTDAASVIATGDRLPAVAAVAGRLDGPATARVTAVSSEPWPPETAARLVEGLAPTGARPLHHSDTSISFQVRAEDLIPALTALHELHVAGAGPGDRLPASA